MQVLVTGAFGNIGSAVVKELLRQGHHVRAFDLRSARTEAAARKLKGALEICWGDMRRPADLQQAVQGQEAVIHLAAVIPPRSNTQPELARQVNVEGTRSLIQACQALPSPPRFLLASTLDLFGYTQKKAPPRRISEPVVATDPYTGHKIACEKMVHESGLPWLIFRFCDVPLIGLRPADPIMYEIALYNRVEVLHPADAGLAVANALGHPELWGRGKTLLIGGGPHGCQLTYREYFDKLLTVMGIGTLPEAAWSQKEYVTDWLDTEESQTILQYQRHTFDQIVTEVAAALGWRRFFVPLARPFVRRSILKMSPYWKK